MIVLIPSYEPDERLAALITSLDPAWRVVVVDDGSGPDYGPMFLEANQAGATVLTQPSNRGKGAALKLGYEYIAAHFPGEDVVCADSDGQHRPDDIAAVAAAIPDDHTMVLGVREFTGRVPARSRIGNAVTAKLFSLTTGHAISDTQTGLRAYPAAMLPWLCSVPGDRFEYELNLLLRASGAGYGIKQVPIATIYLDENTSSHFRPVRDSIRIYAPLLKFSASSLAAAGVDFGALFALNAITGSLLASVVGARVLSSAVNFATNRSLVFDSNRPLRETATRYFGLVVAILAANYALLAGLTGVGLALFWAKLLTEVTLFVISYTVQQRVVFRDRSTRVVSRQPQLVNA